MPPRSRGPHLYLKKRPGGAAWWYIRDGKRRVATGAREIDLDGAREALGAHIARTTRPDFSDGHADRVQVSAIVALYAKDVAPSTRRPKETAGRLLRVLDFWGNDTVDQITPTRCRAYVRARGSEQAARRELEDLRSAVNYAFRNRLLKAAVPVHLPEKAQPRERWLTRQEAARLILGALGWRMAPYSDLSTRAVRWRAWSRDGARNPHVARFVILGLRTGTRHDAILGLSWLPSTSGGHVDLDHGLIYRRGSVERETKKRRPPVPIDGRLAAHLHRWKRLPHGAYVVSYDGSRMDRMQRAWRSARALAALDDDVTPHVLRHTFVTWAMQRGEPIWIVAGKAGMEAAMIERVYAHHSPEYLTTKAGVRR